MTRLFHCAGSGIPPAVITAALASVDVDRTNGAATNNNGQAPPAGTSPAATPAVTPTNALLRTAQPSPTAARSASTAAATHAVTPSFAATGIASTSGALPKGATQWGAVTMALAVVVALTSA